MGRGQNQARKPVLLNPHTGAMKKRSTSDVIGEMQIRAMKLLLKWPKSRTLTSANAGEAVEQQEPPFLGGGNAKWYSHFGKQFGNFL